MSTAKTLIDSNYLRLLVPINELTQENLMDLAGKTSIEELPKGKSLFKKGDNDNFSYYLIQGDVALISGNGPDKVISGGTAPSRFPLNHYRPRQASAITQTDIRYIRIDNDLLDILLTWDQNASYMVNELENDEEDDNDWMTLMLRSYFFHRIPAGNIQAVFMRTEAVSYQVVEFRISPGVPDSTIMPLCHIATLSVLSKIFGTSWLIITPVYPYFAWVDFMSSCIELVMRDQALSSAHRKEL